MVILAKSYRPIRVWLLVAMSQQHLTTGKGELRIITPFTRS